MTRHLQSQTYLCFKERDRISKNLLNITFYVIMARKKVSVLIKIHD